MITLIVGDITQLAVDAIVNAANPALAGGGGVDGAIHRAAGPELKRAAVALAPCSPGEARITPGFRLPARYVIHTVGPVWHGGGRGEAETLARCYAESLRLAAEAGVRDIAFPAISTGVYGYPRPAAATIATDTARQWLADHPGVVARVLFVAFSAADAAPLRAAIGPSG